MLLVLDTEVATDLTRTMPGFRGSAWSANAQSLMFGTARLYVRGRTRWRATDEWLFHPDDLPEHGLAVLRQWVAEHTERVGEAVFLRGTQTKLHLCPLTALLKDFYRIAYEGQAMICGFNLPFDLSRLAWKASPARGRFEGGFRLDLYAYADERGKPQRDPYRPAIRIRNLGGHKASMAFTGVKADDDST
jgi:hypothetical protein